MSRAELMEPPQFFQFPWRTILSFSDSEIKDGRIVPKDNVWSRCTIIADIDGPVNVVDKLPKFIADHIVLLHNATLHI